MANEKFKLVYIASSGRSGSTLLELMFGSHPQLWTLGELYVLPFAVQSEAKPCGCGAPVGECPFWGPILQQHKSVVLGPSIGRFRDGYDVGRLFQFGEFPSIWSRNGSWNTTRQAQLAQFGADNVTLLKTVLEKSRQMKGDQVTWLVDASKSIYRLLWLKQCGLFDLRVIHLVKDPRAFVYSISKRADGSVDNRRAARATFRWNAENYLLGKLFRNRFAEDEVRRIRYEELASRTEPVLKETLAWLGLPYDPRMVTDFRSINHGIAGNPMRHRSNGIHLDEKWRSGLSTGMQNLVRGASLVLSNRYGFTR